MGLLSICGYSTEETQAQDMTRHGQDTTDTRQESERKKKSERQFERKGGNKKLEAAYNQSINDTIFSRHSIICTDFCTKRSQKNIENTDCLRFIQKSIQIIE